VAAGCSLLERANVRAIARSSRCFLYRFILSFLTNCWEVAEIWELVFVQRSTFSSSFLKHGWTSSSSELDGASNLLLFNNWSCGGLCLFILLENHVIATQLFGYFLLLLLLSFFLGEVLDFSSCVNQFVVFAIIFRIYGKVF